MGQRLIEVTYSNLMIKLQAEKKELYGAFARNQWIRINSLELR